MPEAPQHPWPRAAAHRRRDRRGRGLRRASLPASLPGARTRAEAFDDLVLDAVERLEIRWAAELADIEFAVEEVPPAELEPGMSVDEDTDEVVPLARTQLPHTSRDPTPPRIVVHRRPIEARARSREELADLILDVVIHEVARLLETTPDVIDPEGHAPGG